MLIIIPVFEFLIYTMFKLHSGLACIATLSSPSAIVSCYAFIISMDTWT